MRIVIVEDEAPIREGMEGILKKLDASYELVGKAENGREGLDVIRAMHPDVIIMDIQMPDMDGLTMLSILRQEGSSATVLILSAYSDFEYARRAMELGVVNYLLKPVRLAQLKKVLEQIENARKEEERARMLLAPENIIRSAMIGALENNEETRAALEQQYGIREGQPMALLLVWLGSCYGERKDITLRILNEVLEHTGGLSGVLLPFPEKNRICLAAFHMDEKKDWEQLFCRSVLPMLAANTESRAVCSMARCRDIFRLQEADQVCRGLLEWSLTLGNEELLTPSLVDSLHTGAVNYPPERNVRLKQIMIREDNGEFASFFSEFYTICRDGIHDPREIKGHLLSCIWTIISTAREYSRLNEQEIRVKDIMEEAVNIFTWEQAELLLKKLYVHIFRKENGEHRSYTLLIQRARRMIEECYSQQITLEEAARTLGVSSEYLSRQYKKETGNAFSEDLRSMKVEKVKTLLIGTGLNLTRIAAMTGFSDPKYMSRVFREEVGVLPAEYRRLHL